jgi:GNAT superfamily N-acetyltransferase
VTDIALDDAHVGERWVLRHRLSDGSATDVIGWLMALAPASVLLQTENGEHITVDRATIVVAKRAPAARGGPDPHRVSADELELAALPGWVALSEPLGEWTLRAGGGFTGRANSALAVGDPGVSLAEAADRVIAYAGRHGIAPWAQVIVGSDVEAGLGHLGWRPVYVVTDVLVCRLTTLLDDGLPDPRVQIDTDLTSAWWDAYGRSRPNDSDPSMLRMMLEGHPPRAFASVRGSATGDLVGIARGHIGGFWLGIASVWVGPDVRRQGLATTMMRALGHWAARQGARYAYLQVAQENTDAHAAYGRLGFVLHHSYRYLQAPDGRSTEPDQNGT